MTYQSDVQLCFSTRSNRPIHVGDLPITSATSVEAMSVGDNAAGSNYFSQADVHLDPQSREGVNSKCAKGALLGGGFASDSDVYIIKNSPTKDTWLTYAEHKGSSSSGTQLLSVYPVCVSGLPIVSTSFVYASANVAVGQIGVKGVSCPAGMQIASGGFFAAHPAQFLGSRRDTKAWVVGVKNDNNQAIGMTTYAICVK